MLTVILSTFNGERTLPTALEAHASLDYPEGGWKIVVVDNGSTDRTAEILKTFANRLPLTYLHVSERGKNRAINKGLEHRDGELVVFTDDDAIPARGWLAAVLAASLEHVEYDVFSGAIVPEWERQPEAWLLDWVPKGVTYALTDRDQEEGPVRASGVWGPNMAVRSRIFDEGHRFDEQIGPKSGTSYPMGSETDLTTRLERLGHKAWFVKGAIVRHMIRSFQMERSWVLARAIRYGRGMYRRDRLQKAPPPHKLFGVPRHLLREIPTHFLQATLARLLRDNERRFREEWELRYRWGYLLEANSAAEG